MKIRANCAARTVVADIVPIVEIAQRTGVRIECCTFIGSSPIRQYAEGWTLDYLGGPAPSMRSALPSTRGWR